MDHFRAGRRPNTAAAILVTTVVVAQLVATAVCLLALVAGLPLWAAVVVGVVLGGTLFTRIGGRFAVTWAATALRYIADRRPVIGRTTDFHAPGETVGLHWIDGQVIALVELIPPPGNGTRVTLDAVDSPDLVPVAALAACLNQHDVALSGIDILAHGCRTVAGTPAADVYDSLIGPLPAVARMTVWIALRFDAASNGASVARRGGGEDGAARTVSVAARRVVRALADAGCPSRILPASEVESVAARICRGVHPDTMGQQWSHVPLQGVCNIGNAIDPRHLSRELLTAVWAAPGLGTTVTVRLRPGSDKDSMLVGAAFRRTIRTAPTRRALRKGLLSMQGTHRDALVAHLPIASPALDDLTPLRARARDLLDDLCLPVTGCGQLVGSDSQGNAVTARIFGPGVRDVLVAGEVYLAQQLVFRAVATGARVLIHTDRPHAWSTLVEAVGAPTRLRVAHESSWSETGFDTLVVDGVPAPQARPGVTTLHVHSSVPQPRPAAALSIVQPGASGDRVILTAGRHSVELTLVTISPETAFLGRPRPASLVSAR
ncbi:type VII secretion protein EccE [Rhodococcus sp. OK519]|uniref:type VII secretion protein EccE n=1 Tax=Rhodococcus sp. OK519 TaxID=2135729 RepID=UPI000D36DC74|nr:type VII secretion protein EccE [Rhodococcus sp. OK519]